MLRNLFRRRTDARSSLLALAKDVLAIAPGAKGGPSETSGLLTAMAKAILDASVADLRAAEHADCEENGIATLVDGVLHIPIDGLLMSRGSSAFRWFGFAATSYREIDDAIARAKRADVERVVLHVHSPGGQLSGLQATASRLYRLGQKKPVRAEGRALVASAAYWLASQATELVADEGTELGSIGVFSVLEDSSKLFEALGVEVHVVSSGPHKGAGVRGAPIREGDLEYEQEKIDEASAEFVAAVARGRDLSPSAVEELATGATWSASEAVGLRLVDAVEDLDDPETDPNLDSPEGDIEEDQEEQEAHMDKKEIEALIAEAIAKEREDGKKALDDAIAKERAESSKRLDAQSKTLAELAKDQKAEVLDRAIADGKILPAERAVYEKVAESTEPKAFAELLGKLVPRVQKTPKGKPGRSAAESTEPIDEKGMKLRRALGVTGETSVFREAAAMLPDGRFLMPDGSIVRAPREEN